MATDEADLRRQLDAVHRQMLERDNAFRYHERVVQERDRQIEERDRQIGELRDELMKIRDWANELEAAVRRLEGKSREMEATIGWRAEMRLRSLLRRSGRP